jgi:hypothetical protein
MATSFRPDVFRGVTLSWWLDLRRMRSLTEVRLYKIALKDDAEILALWR